MADKSLSGKKAILFNAEKGTLIEGNASTPLADNSWFIISAKATSSTLPLRVGDIFKTPDSENAITPAIGDNVFPITLSKICKVDASISTEKGTIDVTDDCEEGYNAYIVDGYSDISGSGTGFLKYDETTGELGVDSKAYLNRFFDLVSDDGAGTYSLTAKNDDDIFLAILNNSDFNSEGNIQEWLMVPAILTGITTDKPLKGVQNFDFNWQKAQGPASIYERTTNSEETVF